MYRLKIFVRVQNFRRVPSVLPRNFCHPAWLQDCFRCHPMLALCFIMIQGALIHNTVFFATHNSLYPSEKKTVFVMFEPTYYIFNGYHVYTPEATFSYNSNIQYSVTSVNVHRPMMPFSQYWYNIPHFLGISQTSKWIKWMVSLQRFSHIANSIQIIDVCFYSLE